MRAEVARVCRLHLAQPADRNRHMRVRGATQLVIEIDVGDFAVEFVFAANGAATAAGGDLQVEAAKEIAIRPGCAALHEQRRRLQLVCGRREPRNGGPRHANDEVGAQMRDQVLTHQRQAGQAGTVKGG